MSGNIKKLNKYGLTIFTEVQPLISFVHINILSSVFSFKISLHINKSSGDFSLHYSHNSRCFTDATYICIYIYDMLV